MDDDDQVRLISSDKKDAVIVTIIEDSKDGDLPLLPATSQASLDGKPTPRQPQIPARDTSRAAWTVLCGAILVQATLFAFPMAFGVFQEFFGNDKDLSGASQSIWIGVLSTGLPFFGAPIMTGLCENRSQAWWPYYVLAGWLVCVCSLVGAAFSKSLIALAITQGTLYALGLLLLDVPTLLILNTWFVKRRGLAYGLLFGACDLIGVGMTLMAEVLLHRYSFRVAMLSFACVLLGVCGPSIWLLKPRPTHTTVPISQQNLDELTLTPLTRRATSNLCPKVIKRYYTKPIFYIFSAANLFHALGYYLPFMYLPSYATSIGYSPSRGAYLLAIANFAQIIGEVGFGQLSDRVNIHILIFTGSLFSSVAVLALWGMSHSFTLLVAFALVFGSFGSGIISLWARMGTFFGQKDAQMIYSIMSFGRGLGNIVSGPISTALLASTGAKAIEIEGQPFRYGNGTYLGVVLFVGISMGLSALIGVAGLLTDSIAEKSRFTLRRRATTFQELRDRS